MSSIAIENCKSHELDCNAHERVVRPARVRAALNVYPLFPMVLSNVQLCCMQRTTLFHRSLVHRRYHAFHAAPEVLRGGRPTAESDVYSFGVVAKQARP